MGNEWADVRAAFEDAAAWFVATVQPTITGKDDIPSGERHWDGPGLGSWTLRDLVGHTSRALLTVETYLAVPAERVEVATAADYFRIAMASLGDPVAVEQRGRDAGAALGDDPSGAVAAIAGRVLPLLGRSDPDGLVGTPVGGMRLVDYLPTRTFELTAHTCDIATALGREPEPPHRAAAATLRILAELAAGNKSAGSVIAALTGRRGLPDGFTAL